MQLIDYARRGFVALGVAALALAGLVAPAHATTVPALPLQVAWADACDGTTTATFASRLRIVALVRVTGGGELNVPAGEKTIATVPGHGKGALTAEVKVLGVWKPLGKTHEWALPRGCKPAKPTIVVTLPTCDKPTTGVTLTNPNKAIPVKVRASGAQPVTLQPGESTTVALTASTWIRWGVKAAVWKLDLVKHQPATCPTPTATATAAPTPTPTVTASATPTATTSASPTATVPGGSAPTQTAPGLNPVGNNDNDPQGGLPITGANVGVLLTVGALVLLAGALGVVVARRRRTRFTA